MDFPNLIPMLAGVVGAAVVGVVVITFILAAMFRVVVATNITHIVQRKNTSVEYGRERPAGNVYYAWPSWVPVIGVSVIALPESNFPVPLENYEAYDKARLPFMVDIVGYFRIADPIKAAQRVSSFDSLTKDLRNVLQGSVRKILGSTALEEILHQRSELGKAFTAEVSASVAEWGVQAVKTIEFMDLRDSSKGNVIQNIMDKEKSRIDRESREAIAGNEKSAQEAEIKAKRDVELQRQEAEQAIGARTAEKDKKVGIAKEQAQQEILDASKITAERDMAVKQVRDTRSAAIAKEVAETQALERQRVAEIQAQAQKNVTVTIAEGQLEEALKKAEGIRAEGLAAASAEEAMLMAPVTTQITLAKEVGSNDGYQQFLISSKQVEAQQAVGVAMAAAMEKAEMKIIANSGDMQSGVTQLADMFTPAGGTKLSGMLTALAQTPEGQKLVDSLPAVLGNGSAMGALVGAATGSSTAGAVAGSTK